jgi:S-DNA-T family DNA segregation ATPase FtsK/SpoIIIE
VKKREAKPKAARVPGLKAAAFVLLGLATLTGLSLASISRDLLTEGLITLLRRFFGAGVYLVPLALGILGFWLLLESLGSNRGLEWRRPLGAILLFLTCLPALHLLPFPEDARQYAAQGGGGGYLGWLLSQALTATVGLIGAYITLAASGIVGLILLCGVSLARAGTVFKRVSAAVGDRYGSNTPSLTLRRPQFTASALFSRLREKAPAPFDPRPAADKGPKAGAPLETSRLRGGKEWRLPSVEHILERNAELEISETEIRRKVRVIEETLLSFGVPGRVVEVNQGPTVTQFGVEPGYVERKGRDGRVSRAKVRVSKIGSLAKDLSLALAATAVRIEAPVPGRSMIGIEVPNDELSLVSLRRLMESDEFHRMTSRLKIALGQDVSGNPVVADLGRMPHLLIAGATGSGKSVCINSIVTCLLLGNTPNDLRLLMIDPKMVELVNFNGIPHLLSPVLVEVESVVGTLRWVLREMDRRYKLFSAAQARSIDHYNQDLLSEGGQPLPYIVVVVDELADLMMAAPDEVERSLCRLAQMSRATGIHLVVATQRPSVDVVTGLIKANFPARISFAVTSQADSRVILDMAGADKLLGKGDMLYMSADSSSPVRLQGCFVSDREIDSLVRFWRGMEVPRPAQEEELVQQALWPEIATIVEDEEDQDDQLLEEAIELVKSEKRASTTFLQRRLRIGYVRAARLMDLLEEKGVVGPPASAGRARKVLNVAEEEVSWPTT